MQKETDWPLRGPVAERPVAVQSRMQVHSEKGPPHLDLHPPPTRPRFNVASLMVSLTPLRAWFSFVLPRPLYLGNVATNATLSNPFR